MGAIGIIRRGHAFQQAGSMQTVQAGQAGGARLILRGGRIFAAIPAGAPVNARHQRATGTFPDEGFGRDLLLAFGALGQIKGLEMSLQAFVAFAGGGQFGERLAQIGPGGGLGGHFEQEAGDRVIDRHQSAIALPGYFNGQLGRGAQRIEHPGAAFQSSRSDMPGQKGRADSFLNRRQVARQGSGLGSIVAGDVRQIIHMLIVYKELGEKDGKT